MPGRKALVFCGVADNFLFKSVLSNDEFQNLAEEIADYPHMIPDQQWYSQRKYQLHEKLWNK